MRDVDWTPSIRIAQPGDLDGLMELYRQLVGAPEPECHPAQGETLARMLAHPGLTVFVAQVGDVLAATCTLVVTPHLPRGCAPFALVENVVTHSDHRQKGLGLAVLAAARQAAFAAGCYKIMLLTGSQSPATHAFYRRAGFEQTKTGYQIRAEGYPARVEI